ncbi:MAG: TIGR02147 family protein [Bacteriovoracia bacterium]
MGPSSVGASKPNIFEYSDYRVFLGDYYNYMKSHKRFFSYRYFAKAAGYSSSNFFKLIISGKRNLSPASTQRTIDAMGLSRPEGAFFTNLVGLNQAANSEERERFATALVLSAHFKKIYPLKEAQYNYFAEWFYIPIREMVGKPGFDENPAVIAQQLNPTISTAQARKALDDLEQLGLVKRDEGGKLVQCAKIVNTPDNVTSALVTKYHKQMIRIASESIDRFAKTERDLSAITLAVSDECAQEIKQLSRQFKEQVLELVAKDSGSVGRVYQLCLQLFPISHKIKKESA